MKTAIRQNRSTALATAALLFGLPRPAAGQTMDAGDHSQAAAQARARRCERTGCACFAQALAHLWRDG